MIAIIILAAGFSTRFGRNKLLLKIDDRSMIEKVVKNALNSKSDEIVVVLGYQASEIRYALREYKDMIRYVFNEKYQFGQSYSVKAGLKEVFGRVEAIIIIPADLFLLSFKSIDKVINEYRSTGGNLIIATHNNCMGHPILIDSNLFNEVMNINEETLGLKYIINKHLKNIIRVDINSDEVLIDFDTEKDLKKYYKRLGQNFH